MSRTTLVELTKRSLVHAKAGTVPQAESIVEVPASNYFDHDRWVAEMERVFKRVPLTLGFSAELREPGSYRAMDVVGVPLILSRGRDGVMRSFLNICSHRGAVIMPEGTGSTRRFTCPYHAWSYDDEGALVGILDRNDFGDIDQSCNGLVELPCEERAGLIFGSVAPDNPLDLDAYLNGYGDMLGLLNLDACHLVGRQEIAGPNWKVAYDGYLDLYHLPILHKDTFGSDYNNKAIYDAWGPHQHVTGPDKRLLKYADVDPSDWTDSFLTTGLWTIFPHVSIARFDVSGGALHMVSQLFPGDGPESSVTVQSFLANFEPNDEQAEAISNQMKFLFGVVRDEDYATGLRLQRALKTGLKSHVMFGRNEAGGQRFHGWVEDLVGAQSDADYRTLLAQSSVIFQP